MTARANPGAPSPEAAGFLGAVLAGGRNRRFGGHKALASVCGTAIAARGAAALAQTGCDPVVVIANDPDRYAVLDLPVRPDPVAGIGPLAGILSALRWAHEEGRDGVVLVAGDMPFPSPSLLRALAAIAASEDADAAVPESESKRGLEPLCAAYGIACLPAVEARASGGGGRIVAFYDDVRVVRVPLSTVATHGEPARMFLNVNTREELAMAERLACPERASADAHPEARA